MGDFDQPAMVSFVLEKTGAKNVTYIGHSMGSSQMFYSLSVNKQFWANKINLFVALAPVASMQHFNNPLILWLQPFTPIIEFVLKLLNQHSLFGYFSQIATSVICLLDPLLCRAAE